MSKRSKKKEKKRERGASAKRRAEIHKGGYTPTAIKTPEGVERFKEKAEKQYRLDIIPFVLKEANDFADAGQLHWELTYYAHRQTGVDGNSYICPKEQIGERCPICEYRAKLARDPDADAKLVAALRPKQRQLFRVIDRKNTEAGIQLWDISFHNFGKRLDARIRNSDEDDRYNEFYELEDGLTLKVGFAEKSFEGGGRPFPDAESIDFKARKDDYDEEVLDQDPDLDECLIILDYDELKRVFMQIDDDDNDEKPKSTKKSKKKAAKKESTPEPDEPEFEKGDRVSAEIDGEAYEGAVKKVKDDEAVVLFDDGDKQTIDLDDLTKLEPESSDTSWEEDDRVVVEIDGEDYAGKITDVDAEAETVSIEYDDGDTADDVPFDDLKEEPDAKTSTKKDKGKGSKKDKSKVKDGECPGGGTFGEDTDELTACNDCPNWDKCDDA